MRDESNVVPLKVARKGVPEEDGYQVYYGSGSQEGGRVDEVAATTKGDSQKEVVANAFPVSYVEKEVGGAEVVEATFETETVCLCISLYLPGPKL